MGPAGFSSTTVWLVFGAFIFALGMKFPVRSSHCPFPREIHGQTHADVGLCDCHYRHSAGTVYTFQHRAYRGTVFPVIKTCRRCLNHSPNDPSARRIGGYLMWMMVISTSLSSSMFVTGAAPNVLGSGVRQQNCRYPD